MPSNDLTTPENWDDQWVRAKRSNLYNTLHWLVVRKLFRTVCDEIDRLDHARPTVLEVGCAPGTFLEYMHQFRPQYRLSGLDYAPQGVELTRQRLWAQQIEAKVYQGDLQSFEPDEPYDAVFSWGLVEHFIDPVPIARHHARLVTDGGLVVITIPNYATRPVQYFIQHFDPTALQSHNLELMRKTTLRDTLIQAGLKQVRTGSVGGPQVRAACTKSGLASRLYRTMARLWNLSVATLPLTHVGWDISLWASGRVGGNGDWELKRFG